MNLWSHCFSQNRNKIVWISAQCSEGRNLDNFSFVFWEKRWLHKFILTLSDLKLFWKWNLYLMTFQMELINFLEELHNPNDAIEETRIIGFPCFLMTPCYCIQCKVKQKCILPYPFPLPCQRVLFYDFLPIL